MSEPTSLTPLVHSEASSAHALPLPAPEIKSVSETTCCIVGAGPAGVMLALLLLRKGVRVTLLEAHMDFEREFRGDTIHPVIMENLDLLGLADPLLQLRHSELKTVSFQNGSSSTQLAVFSLLKTKFPFITVIAQSRFLEFMIAEAQKYPHFQLIMGAQVDALLEEQGLIQGVRYRGQDGWHDLHAVLTVAADGRFSRIRRLAGFEPVKSSPPMDILWFRLSRASSDPDLGLGGYFGHGALIALIDRFDYWQVGYVIPKGGYQQVRSLGLEHVRQVLALSIPFLSDRVSEIQEWKQISVLSVESSYLTRWHRSGLLLIGDAAHVMSPVGGVGINYAIQDAIAAANILAPNLQFGIVHDRDLAAVQRQRALPIRLIQAVQALIQNQLLVRALHTNSSSSLPAVFRLITRLPFFGILPASIIGYGFFPARIKK